MTYCESYEAEASRVLDFWHLRLVNWSLWKAGSGGGYSGAVSGAYFDDWMHPPRLPCPLVGEALDTDDLVQKLCAEHRIALTAAYLWTYPDRLEDRAKALGLTPRGFRERIRQAKFRLDDLDHARRRAMIRPPKPVPETRQAEERIAA